MGTNQQNTIRVLIANDHPIICAGLRSILTETGEIDLLGCTTTMPETIRLVGEWQPDVLLVDPHIQGQDGFKYIEMIRGEWPHIAIIVLTTHQNEEQMLRSLHTGASAYLTLHTEREGLLHAIRTAIRGETLLHLESMTHLLARINPSVPKNTIAPIEREEEQTLTKREREILQRVACGERNKEIAARLGISEPTVKSHLVSIYFKLGVDSRASAVVVAIERGILSPKSRHL
jgi:NarL family two-component system response regulator YdfI